ncbi:SIR2 family NAD-dependent protein deacylase [Salinadaptatus halalkaliphilus]|uniref:hypothetical protein n=1 Tax=Salinadaptatus halalkaliphilus TaxID=2419781 RepID=UPI0015809150|nr:hypothetical protein [Salinadaptatus halalkaliphilus]
MAGDDQYRGSVSISLPPDVDDWLADIAAEQGQTRDELCRRLVTAAHSVSTADEIPGNADTSAEIDRQLEEVTQQLEDVENDLEDHRAEFTDLIEDVRSRVIQVKREADAKAPADHDHPSYAAADDLEVIRADVDDLEDRLEGGFENFETILEDLLDRVDQFDDRSTTLARAVLELRRQYDEIVERERRHTALADLQRAANRAGIRSATCEDCGASVDIALLTEPACPDCGSSIVDVVENTSFFGSDTLVTGDPPALEGSDDPASETDDVFEAVESEAIDESTNEAGADAEESTPSPDPHS